MKDEVKNGIIIFVCVMLILVVVYFTTAVFLTGEIGGKKNDKDNKTSVDASNNSSNRTSNYNNMIITGKTFSQNEDNYMVLFFSEKEASESLKTAITSYDSSSNDIKLYKVNVDEAINKYVKSDKDNVLPTNSSNLKISGNALITISSGDVTSYINEEEVIINTLK